MDKKTLEQLIIVLPIAFIVSIFVYIKYALVPINLQIKQRKEILTKIKSDYESACKQAARLENLKQEIQILEQEIEEMKKVLPESKKLPYLIRELKKKMEIYNIFWSNLTPGTRLQKEFYSEHSYSIPFKSDYHDLASFMADAGQAERIYATKFKKLSLAADPKDQRITLSGDLTFLYYTEK